MASVSPLAAVLSHAGTRRITRKNQFSRNSKNVVPKIEQKLRKNGGALGNVVEVLQKDANFLKDGLNKGLEWANKAFRIPEVSRSVEDFVWLRNAEDPQAALLRFPSWPQPCYPELSGADLLMADLKALEVYASYFYYTAKMWTKPLPEIYDAEEVTEYFALRPHVVALRLLEIYAYFWFPRGSFRIFSWHQTDNTRSRALFIEDKS